MSNFSPRYERFLPGKKAKQDEGRWSQVPFYEAPQKLKFSGKELAQLDAREGWVPLATLGQEEARYFVVKAGDSACPVALWEPERETFTPHAHSLDSFLASLGTTKTTAKGTEAVVDLRDSVPEDHAADRRCVGVGAALQVQEAKADAGVEAPVVAV